MRTVLSTPGVRVGCQMHATELQQNRHSASALGRVRGRPGLCAPA